MAEPILIWGAGAIGGTIAAFWARAGLDVLLVDIVEEHVEVCRTRGLRITGPVETFEVVIPAITPDALEGVYGRIVLAVKAQHTVAALKTLKPHLADDGFVLSAQNGLNELEISRQVGAARTMGAFVNFGADWRQPGEIMFGNRGAVVVGEIDGGTRTRTKTMLELLRVFEPDAVLSDNIWGYLWGKLGYGAMLFATATNGDSMADNFADDTRFPVWRALGAEVMATTVARNIQPAGFNGFDPACFAPGASPSLVRKSVADLAEFNRHSSKTHSGIWRDLAVRKRRTEIDAQIAIIADLASEVGVKTPVIRRLVELIHDIEDGRREQSMDTFAELIRICE